MPDSPRVALVRDPGAAYPPEAPFHPSETLPELPGAETDARPNHAHALVRELFLAMGLDRARAGTPAWNPLGDVVRPGDHVLLKPNLVHHGSGAPAATEVLLTHGGVVRAVLDYVVRALDGRGTVSIGDAPLQSGDFERIVRQTGLRSIVEYLGPRAGVPLRLVDFRQECVTTSSVGRFITGHRVLGGDALGYLLVDLQSRSAHVEIEADFKRYRVTDYEGDLMERCQAPGRHQYVIPRVVLDADVVINLPKMKTHRKTGLTCALKNLVGINGRKDCLPHHRKGALETGGDEFQHASALKSLYTWCDELADRVHLTPLRIAIELAKHVPKLLAKRLARDAYFEGSWFGNDTLWRTVHDLNRILYYVDKTGAIQDRPTRRVLHVVDAIVAGEGEGPLEADPVRCGMLLGGTSPVAVDAVAAMLMGLDPGRIPILHHGFGAPTLPIGPARPEDIAIHLRSSRAKLATLRRQVAFHFVPPAGWRDHIELSGSTEDADPGSRALAGSGA
jgi:uncharacterized protein (DUF362 family)